MKRRRFLQAMIAAPFVALAVTQTKRDSIELPQIAPPQVDRATFPTYHRVTAKGFSFPMRIEPNTEYDIIRLVAIRD